MSIETCLALAAIAIGLTACRMSHRNRQAQLEFERQYIVDMQMASTNVLNVDSKVRRLARECGRLIDRETGAGSRRDTPDIEQENRWE